MGRNRFAQTSRLPLRAVQILNRAGVLLNRASKTRFTHSFQSTSGTLLAVFLFLIATFAAAQTPQESQKHDKDTNPLGQLVWRFIGPNGNRAAAIAGVPGNPMVDYVGAASGGIWKTENGGVTWKPIFDHEDVSAIGALAVSQSAPNVVWAGTGETWLIRPYYPMGNGVYKSTDAGGHWQHMGLEATGHIGRIVIDPHNPDRVFVCALGQAFKPQHERGVFRTLDGGHTWQQVLFVNEDTGCNDLAMNPADPNTLYAGMWSLLIHPWNLDSGGTGGGVYVSRDGGTTWHKVVEHGMPAADHAVGKVAVAVAPSDPDRVYALVQDTQPSLYRSDDSGVNWTLVSHDHMMLQRDSYYDRFGVSPTDENRLYFLSPNYVISLDGGHSFLPPRSSSSGFASAGGDNHDLWIDPLNVNRIMVANDAGASISLDGSRSFEYIRLPIAQVYHVATDDQIPYNVYGNIQDASSFRGPSNTLQSGFFGGGIHAADFQSVGGCESGFATPDPTNPGIVWSGCYEGVISRLDLRDGQVRDVSVWPDVSDGWAPADVKYRWNWSIPLALSPFNSNDVYVGSQYVHETTDGGQTWKVISPDLTLNDKAHEGNSGGITFDNLYTYDAALIESIALSPVKQGIIWAGTNDGQVSVTRNNGGHWTNVTKNIPNLPPMGNIWNIEPSPFDAGTAYITVNLQQMGDYNAYVYKTTDFGASWQFISPGIPHSPNSSAHCVIEDPVRKGMLYLGTDNAVYVSWDDGGHWTNLNNNLPPAPVYWLTVQKRFNDLVIATYGRGDYILDDVTPLRAYDPSRHDVQLFPPRPAYRFRQVEDGRMSEPGARIVGQNPPYGADLNFYLPAADPHATIEILGAGGKVIRKLPVKAKPGINRVWWDLRGENGRMPHMLVPPPDAPWVPNGPKGYHILTGIMIPRVVRGPLELPGTYTVRLTSKGQTLSAPFTVLPDPHSLGSPATLRAEWNFDAQLLSEIDQVSEMIEHLEWTRQQAASIEQRYGENAADKPIVDAAKSLAARATAIEGKLIDVYLTDGNEDLNRHPSELYQKLTALYDKGEADQGPTADAIAVNDYYRHWMDDSQSALRDFDAKDIPAFNAVLKSHKLLLSIQP
jgi:photosystem II stability/assembly factor-like uncharacterized protein